jgi:DNA-binding MarR family transcriptional regulator
MTQVRSDVDDRPNLTDSDRSSEIKLDLLPGLIGYHLRRAQVTVFNDFVRTMAEEKITPGQFGVLTLIRANPGLTQSALARAVGIERSTMVAVIDALEGRTLVERQAAPADRRSYALILTADGERLLERLNPLVLGHEERIARDLNAAERRTLIALLDRIAGG